MNISLTPELEMLVAEKVKSGMYSTASEVVREALRLLQERDEFRKWKLEQLRKEVQIGLDQAERGEVSAWDPERVLREARERFEKHADAAAKRKMAS
ncbi:MAG: type II toxin-antitoxin system ParD family antitoxin [Phycisphaerales bacterium]